MYYSLKSMLYEYFLVYLKYKTLIMEEINLPQSGDKFFIETGENDEIAWLHKSLQTMGWYAEGYKTAAISAIDATFNDRSLRDCNIYPAIYLIRHYLELRLKECIQNMNTLNNAQVKAPFHHRLKELWDIFNKDYSQLEESKESADGLALMQILIIEIDAADPESLAFRYSEDKNGNLLQKLQYVNLQNLKNTFIKISNAFDGISMQLEHWVELKRVQ